MRLLLVLLGVALYFHGQGQSNCQPEYNELIIEIKTDNYGYETAWELKDKNGIVYGWTNFNTYDNQKIYRDTFCLPSRSCLQFEIFDGFGDGISPVGYYKLFLNDTLIANGGTFTRSDVVLFQCPEGEICEHAIPAKLGSYVTTLEDAWYAFTPDSTGIYHISTCDINTCDTKIWIYDRCEGISIAEDNRSTVFFNDDENICAPQAKVTGYFQKSKTYFLRIGDKENACTDSIYWSLSFEGPVIGCMDPQSCNYDPLATIDDGSCLPEGHSKCPLGPDLRVREDVLRTSLRLDQVEAIDYCLIDEGCLRGYGGRDVLRFSTHIENIGEKDYYIGKPSFDNPQFNWDNCHNHFHYDNYAEYLLYSESGVEIPIGFKNGFCITDFGCPPGRLPKFSCDNMGLSAGCYDVYWSELQCQWIDLTDVPDGRYVFVVRVNWKNAPDALGQIEKDTTNNWAQVCIELDRSSGKLQLNTLEDCSPLRDCLGKPYGNAQPDCTGTCGGTTLMGDVDENNRQSINDAHTYVTKILGNDITSTICNDLNTDGNITVYDAALMANCANFGNAHAHTGTSSHDHCQFPGGIKNLKDTVSLSILDVNWEDQYIDIGLRNPTAAIVGYQFIMKGIDISYVENLVSPHQYPIAPRTNSIDGTIIGISYQDSLIVKSQFPQPLCRVHFQRVTSDSICISKIVDMINSNYEQVITQIEDGITYRQLSSVYAVPTLKNVQVYPNPFHNILTISFHNVDHYAFVLEVTDSQGKTVLKIDQVTDDKILFKQGSFEPGIYFFRLYGEKGYTTGKLIAL